jgi:hypothetical protein
MITNLEATAIALEGVFAVSRRGLPSIGERTDDIE